MSSACDIYAQQLFRLKHGYPLWDPEPTKHGEVLVGDVGFINEGAFHRLFNATLPQDDPLNRYGVPDGYEPLQLGTDYVRMTRTDDISPGPLCSHTVKCLSASAQITVQGSGGGLQFQCTDEQGAVLITKEAIDRDALLPNRWMVKYMRQHYHSWYVFATETQGLTLTKEELIFVRGWAKTADWSVAAFMHEGQSAQLSFNGDFGLPASASFSIAMSDNSSPILQRNSGPRANRLNHHDAGSSAAGQQDTSAARSHGSKRDQCVFLHYYKLKVRFGLWPTVMKAAAGPHNLPDASEDDQDDGAMHIVDTGDIVSIDNYDIDEVPAREKPYDPIEIVLDYILSNSAAAVAIATDADVFDLCKDGDLPNDLSDLIEDLKPEVQVDQDGVGTIVTEPQQPTSHALPVAIPEREPHMSKVSSPAFSEESRRKRKRGRSPKPADESQEESAREKAFQRRTSKGAGTSMGGCWTCRLRRKKCDEIRDEEGGSCQTCRRLGIECLGWSPKRPEWMRDREQVAAYKAYVKEQLTRAGLIRGHPRAAYTQELPEFAEGSSGRPQDSVSASATISSEGESSSAEEIDDVVSS